MESDVKLRIARNLVQLRKNKGLTQMNFASEFNYSDKTISKWEAGESLPDIAVLVQICDYYGITMNDLIKEDVLPVVNDNERKSRKTRVVKRYITLALVMVVAITIALMVFLYLLLIEPSICYWQLFIWAVPAGSLAMLIMNRMLLHNEHRAPHWVLRLVLWSIVNWGFIAAVTFELPRYGLDFMWQLYIAGAPVEAIIVLNLIRTKK